MPKTVLIVEDERAIVEILKFNLTRAGYAPLEAADGEAGLQLAREADPDLILLDLMLPKVDGFEVCRRLRAEGNTVPILMLTAREGEQDKVLGLESGADDYITKPFSMNEVIARIRANIRRHKDEVVGNADGDGGVITVRGLSIDKNRYAVRMGDTELELSKKEYELLLFLMQHPGVPFSREDLLDKVWGYGDFIGDVNTVDVTVSRLRKKLEKDPSNPSYLITKRGVGYYIQ